MFGTVNQILRIAALTTAAALPAATALAAPPVDIAFETNADYDGKLVRAQTVFPAAGGAVYSVFDSIMHYPQLHDWIRETVHLATNGDTREFLVQFRFPWPVGAQWSRVEVRRNHNEIVWKQLDGSLVANHGSIRFESSGGNVSIDYRAAIDVDLPELWTRAFKKKFITEFLGAAYARSVKLNRTTATLPAADRS